MLKSKVSVSQREQRQPKFFSFMERGKKQTPVGYSTKAKMKGLVGLPLSPSFRIKTLTSPSESLRTTFSKLRVKTDFTNTEDGDENSIYSIQEERPEETTIYKDLNNFSEFSQKGVIKYQQGIHRL